ncbi:quinol:cytochrome C oxidoreductase [Planctomycetota bacterium]
MQATTRNSIQERISRDRIEPEGNVVLSRVVLVAAAIGLVVSLAFGASDGWSTFFRSYILNFAFVVSLALGAMFFVLLQHLSGASWSVVVRRVAESIAASIPWLGLIGIPILVPVFLGMKEVYPWADAAEVQHDQLLQWKQPYLNPPFFAVRMVIYFGVWSVIARFYHEMSVAQDTSGESDFTTRMRRWSGIGIIALGITLTFFSIDLIQSMTPHWYSTIYGVYFFSGAVVGFFALLCIALDQLQRHGRLRSSVTAEHYHDLGKYLFAFVVFWAYIAFSQYMLVWYANLPEETAWYNARQQSGWWVGVSVLLLVGHFIVPFWALLSRRSKRHRGWLAIVAAWVLFMHWVDVYYLVGPPSHHFHAHVDSLGHDANSSPLHVTDISLLVGIGGVFLWATLISMDRASLIPKRDPQIAESLAFENI